MIHLDTNYLIGLAVPGSLPAQSVDKWLANGERLAASAFVWAEFLNGPVTTQEIALVESVIEPKLVSFEKRTAVMAAELFNRAGRRRGSRIDCWIAAAAILADAELATENKSDFCHLSRLD